MSEREPGVPAGTERGGVLGGATTVTAARAGSCRALAEDVLA